MNRRYLVLTGCALILGVSLLLSREVLDSKKPSSDRQPLRRETRDPRRSGTRHISESEKPSQTNPQPDENSGDGAPEDGPTAIAPPTPLDRETYLRSLAEGKLFPDSASLPMVKDFITHAIAGLSPEEVSLIGDRLRKTIAGGSPIPEDLVAELARALTFATPEARAQALRAIMSATEELTALPQFTTAREFWSAVAASRDAESTLKIFEGYCSDARVKDEIRRWSYLEPEDWLRTFGERLGARGGDAETVRSHALTAVYDEVRLTQYLAMHAGMLIGSGGPEMAAHLDAFDDDLLAGEPLHSLLQGLGTRAQIDSGNDWLAEFLGRTIKEAPVSEAGRALWASSHLLDDDTFESVCEVSENRLQREFTSNDPSSASSSLRARKRAALALEWTLNATADREEHPNGHFASRIFLVAGNAMLNRDLTDSDFSALLSSARRVMANVGDVLSQNPAPSDEKTLARLDEILKYRK